MCLPFLAPVMTGISTFLGGGGAAAAGGAAGASSGIWGTIATAASVGSGVIGAVSQYQNAKTAEATSKVNARAEEVAALEALKEGERRSDNVRRAASIQQGDQKVALAANGVDLSSANAISLLDETRDLSEADAFAIRTNAQNEASGRAQRAANYSTEAGSYKSAATFGPMKTILGTAAKVGNKYAYMTRPDYG